MKKLKLYMAERFYFCSEIGKKKIKAFYFEPASGKISNRTPWLFINERYCTIAN